MPYSNSNVTSEREAFKLPDFVSTCPFPLAINSHYQPASSESEEWLAKAGAHPNEAHKRAFRACNFGLLTAMCYTSASVQRFRILCDFINCLFAFDDLTDEGGLRKDDDGTKRANQIVMNALMDPFLYTTEFRVGEVIRDFWGRAISIGCFEGTRRRFIESTELYLAAVHQQVEKRRTGVIPNLEDYILLRRDTGALKMCFAMGEFGLNLSIPDAVFENDLMKTMQDCANDVVVLSNDIYSWNIEQAQGETCNIISVSMREKGLTIQAAMDFAGRLVLDRIELYLNCKAKLPSYGPAVDREVHGYTRVMEDWMRGGFDWSLESHRYFGDQVSEVKATLSVKLLPFEERIVKPELIPVA